MLALEFFEFGLQHLCLLFMVIFSSTIGYGGSLFLNAILDIVSFVCFSLLRDSPYLDLCAHAKAV
jgi:hypothetical protein